MQCRGGLIKVVKIKIRDIYLRDFWVDILFLIINNNFQFTISNKSDFILKII
jgi:hypothetical protein